MFKFKFRKPVLSKVSLPQRRGHSLSLLTLPPPGRLRVAVSWAALRRLHATRAAVRSTVFRRRSPVLILELSTSNSMPPSSPVPLMPDPCQLVLSWSARVFENLTAAHGVPYKIHGGTHGTTPGTGETGFVGHPRRRTPPREVSGLLSMKPGTLSAGRTPNPAGPGRGRGGPHMYFVWTAVSRRAPGL